MVPPNFSCCGSCTCPLDIDDTNEENIKFSLSDNLNISAVEFSTAVSYIYGISFNDIFNKLEEGRSNLRFCTSCGKLLELCYLAHKNFENIIHPQSLIQQVKNQFENDFSNRKSKSEFHCAQNITEETEYPDEDAGVVEDPFSMLGSPSNNNEDAYESVEQEVDIKYDPIALDIAPETSECMGDLKSRLRKRKVVIKLERLSEENIAASIKNEDPLINSKRIRENYKTNGKRSNKSGINNSVESKVPKKTEYVKKSGKRTKCKFCQKVFSYNYYRYRHLRSHTSKKPLGYLCQLCGKRFCRRYYLKHHYMFVHAPESEKLKTKLECQICGKLIFSVYMKEHVKKHDPTIIHKCDQCDQEYNSMRSLRSHVVRVHTDSSFQCEVCGKEMQTVSSLQQHMKTHGPKTIACDQCPYTFVDKSGLKSHKAAHANERPLVCEECGKTFKYRNHFSSHLRMHREVAEKGEGSVQCDECGGYFKHSLSLYKHKGRFHREKDNLKIYKCSFCGKLLSSAPVLRTHEDMHRKNSNFVPRKYRGDRALPKYKQQRTESSL